jgi:hypothetical protein
MNNFDFLKASSMFQLIGALLAIAILLMYIALKKKTN